MSPKKKNRPTIDEIIELERTGKLPYTDIIVKKDYPIGRIILNRPEKRNAMTGFPGGTTSQLNQAFNEMRVDADIRVILVSANGDCFCSGYDLSSSGNAYGREREKGWAKGLEKEAWTSLSLGGEMRNNPEIKFPVGYWWEALWQNPTPIVTLVDSMCLGGGLHLCNFSDIVYATPDAVFAYPPVRYGSSISMGIIQPWVIGYRKALEMGLTGRFITAQEANDCGLITRIVAREELDKEGEKVSQSIAKVPPMTNYFTKHIIHKYYENVHEVEQWINFARYATGMMEQTDLPGHFWDLFKLSDETGFTEAYKQHREKWGYPDPVLDKEVQRLKKLKEDQANKS